MFIAGGFMAKRLVCASCAAVVFRRIRSGMSDTMPAPTTQTGICADCGEGAICQVCEGPVGPLSPLALGGPCPDCGATA